MIEDLVQDLIDRLDHRHYGKFRGYVHDVCDPENRGRIRAIVPRLLGERTPTGWALPSAPYAGPDQGLFTVPDLGAGVWIEFEEGDLSKPIWSGTWWGAPDADEVDAPDGIPRKKVPAAEQIPPAGCENWQVPPHLPETPQHEYDPRQSAGPKVRILKSASGHHIVLDDRPEYERIEIHDSKGNRLILSREGLDRIMSNERTYNKGNRSARIDGKDKSEVAGDQSEQVGGHHQCSVAGDVALTYGGNLDESVGGAYRRLVDHQGLTEDVSGQKIERVRGAWERRISGAGKDTIAGGYGLTSGGGINLTSAGSVKLAAGMADLSLNAFSVDALLGNISLNSKLGVMQIGGMTAISPLVLGDGLVIHLTMLAQILKLVNPLTVAAYGPALDAWAALTPVLDLSYYGFVKRFPVG